MKIIRELDQSRHILNKIIEQQKASDNVIKLLYKFHDRLLSQSYKNDKFPIARTHSIGITYFCHPKKAFLFLNIHQQFLTLKFFTGAKTIQGVKKGAWLNKSDNLGSNPFHVQDEISLTNALSHSLEAFGIAANW